MSTADSGDSRSKPYKGPESFGCEDAQLFFGRDDETRSLLGLILSTRAALLYAPSGAGKTSILNARIVPQLETEGWTPVLVRPQENPLKAIHSAVLWASILHPEVEAEAIERTYAALVPGTTSRLPLGELLNLYDRLEIGDPRRRGLLAPVGCRPLRVTGAPVAAIAEWVPLFSRLLRASYTLERFNDDVAALSQAAEEESATPPVAVDEATDVFDLISHLRSPSSITAHETALSELTVRTAGLESFFQRVCGFGLTLHRDFGIVLILDQFEEVFTRFYDPSPVKPVLPAGREIPDWRLRWQLFDELRDAYRATLQGEQTRPLPIRFVFSIREEYIGQLGPLRSFMPDLDDDSYRLGLLTIAQASSAVRDPARCYGYDYADRCFEDIIAGLTKENRYIEPAHLQIVCDRLWEAVGKTLIGSSPPSCECTPLPLIRREDFAREDGVAGILRSFLGRVLQDLGPVKRIVALEILAHLITQGRTRTIVDRRSLVEISHRDVSERQAVIDYLTNRAIVRTEMRLGGEFVEVTHEFLIEPILEEVREHLTASADYQNFSLALNGLEHYIKLDFRASRMNLPSLQEFERIHSERHRVGWDRASRELMLRTSIVRGCTPDVIQEWMHRYADSTDGRGSFDDVLERLERGVRLSIADWRVLNDATESVPRSPQALDAMMRAAIRWAKDSEKDRVLYWTKERISLEESSNAER